MIQSHISKQKISFLLLVLIFVGVSGIAQDVKRTEPKWWFGLSGAANFNTYQGTTQMLNEIITVPTAFHKGKGVKPYASLLTEYRPNKTVGFMLNVAYDNRGGKFEEVIAPCNCPADLTTQLSYVSVEPSFRLAPFSNAFYLFIGPTFDFNVDKTFSYDQNKQYYIKGDVVLRLFFRNIMFFEPLSYYIYLFLQRHMCGQSAGRMMQSVMIKAFADRLERTA